jgi:MSHA biogenesis protein MshL
MMQRIRSLRRLAGVLALLVIVSGCQTTPPSAGAAPQAIRDAVAESIATQPPPTPSEEVTAALLPEVKVDVAPPPRVPEARFDIAVTNSPARQFFMSLVEGTRYNMVVHPELGGTVTLSLKAVTISEVMAIAREVYGYEFERTGYGFRVLPARLRTEIYQVNFLNLERSGRSETRVSSGQITQTAEDGFALDDGALTESSRATAVSGTTISTQQPPTTYWQELEKAIKAVLGGSEGRSVVVNPQAGVVVVRAMPHELREVQALLNQTQAIARRQVVLEAKILEVELNDAYRQGINWATILDNKVTIGQIGGGSVFDGGTSIIGGNQGNLDPDNFLPILGTAAQAFGGAFTVAVNTGDFKAFIELLETQGSVNVLSSPRIATMNNQKAVIKVGTDEFFVTDISSTTVTGAATTTSPSIELTPFFSGVALDVTPQISAEGEITLHVHPSVSRVEDQSKSIEFGTGETTLTVPLARSTVREADSIVRASNGQVVVIGGLMEDVLRDDQTPTPGLSKLPLVGALFRHSGYSVRKTELVILLRPLVVQADQPWRNLLEESAKRLDGISNARGEWYRSSSPWQR